MNGAIFDGNNIAGFDFSTVDLSNSSSRSLIGTPAALPTGWRLVNGAFVAP